MHTTQTTEPVLRVLSRKMSLHTLYSAVDHSLFSLLFYFRAFWYEDSV